MIELLYFAWVREQMGSNGERLALPEGVGTVGALLDWLDARNTGGPFAERARLRVAVNQSFAGADAPLNPGDEVAIFPPVTGG